METKDKKVKRVAKKFTAKESIATTKKISKTWEAFLRYQGKPLVKIIDMKAVLK